MKLKYCIEEKIVEIKVKDKTTFFRGEDEVLSKKYRDITADTKWYEEGFHIVDFRKFTNFSLIKNELTNSVRKTIASLKPDLMLGNFSLEKYHKFVNSELHKEVLKKTRRFHFKDLNVQDKEIINCVETIIKRKLGYNPEGLDFEHWIIARINPPKSKGFNPVHKDIYGPYDRKGQFGPVRLKNLIPSMVNIWIPICGVNKQTGLPLVPGSHLLNENKIIRTNVGVTVEGQEYSVNCIKSWDGDSSMKLISPKPGHGIIFSSHLIHGLGVNNNEDETRVSLEFRLHLRTN